MKVCIVGGGAAGMVAAISAKAAAFDAEIAVLERNERLGKKLISTGNGRCNYANVDESYSHFHGASETFIISALSIFGKDDTLEFFSRLGIFPYVDERGRIYPLSLQASSVLDVLRHEIEKSGIEVLNNFDVKSVDHSRGKFTVKSAEDCIVCDRVILATGGCAFPKSGSTGSGHRLAKVLGHSVCPTFPSLVSLLSDYPHLKAIDGVKVTAWATLEIDGEPVDRRYADVLFTDYGVSGPAVMDMSREAISALALGKRADISVNLLSGVDGEDAYELICDRRAKLSEKSAQDFFVGLVNKRLIIPILKDLRIEKEIAVSLLSCSDLRKISEKLSAFKLKICGDKGYGQAQTTVGGVSTDEITPTTMESKIVKGLYFAGELVDVDGDCGGYNLQWAWTSGYIAGKNSVR